MQKVTALFGATMRAAAFLTRLNISGRAFEAHDPQNSQENRQPYRLGDDAAGFPLVGLIVAAPAALLLFGLPAFGFSPLVAAVLAVVAMIAMTGGLHEDGLADVADGLGGHHPRDRALEIMHDSRVGSYGAIALILSIGLRAALLAELAASEPTLAACAVLAAAAASRGGMALFWALTPSALETGLAARVGEPSRQAGWLAAGLGAAIALVFGLPTAGLLPVTSAILLAAGVFLWLRCFVMRRIGGQTGDCLGAFQQLAEIAILIGLAIG
ncbi:adenosylcobinamide-GDP ribazoletransferase [Jiella marina]|uniref:adenosylcobinamide-GDP ribazoletransferase n=1 Tax=Jiella sp. LLJ827 TaxID=2917712 RepID=UPI002101D478|nr:adenosylcobinamide-GDP ribazoletransferase [Jiella sp. LLJ827]MCQ0987727.1 adenosylcobinamide-GDP ribazoletransferase [Jiella sp. LLJ827]